MHFKPAEQWSFAIPVSLPAPTAAAGAWSTVDGTRTRIAVGSSDPTAAVPLSDESARGRPAAGGPPRPNGDNRSSHRSIERSITNPKQREQRAECRRLQHQKRDGRLDQRRSQNENARNPQPDRPKSKLPKDRQKPDDQREPRTDADQPRARDQPELRAPPARRAC